MIARRLAVGDDSRQMIRTIVVGCAAIELLLLAWLIAAGRETFMWFIWTPDSSSYIGVAQQFAKTFTLVEGTRTLGYPLFASVGYLIGGAAYGPYVVIVAQLVLNLAFTWGCWIFLSRMNPSASPKLRAFATVLFFWAGLGAATLLMTDFLAALCFAVFVYGFLFWRTRRGVLVSAGMLALATLTRPTFTFLPLLLPGGAYLVRHVTTRVPVRSVVLFAAVSAAATSLSVAYQYSFNRYLGPSPLLIIPIQEMLYFGTVKGRLPIDYATFRRNFELEISERAGQPFQNLTRGEQEEIAKELFHESFRVHYWGITFNVVKNGVKYVFAPIDSIVERFWAFYQGSSSYQSTIRPFVGFACLPLLVLSLLPPVRGGPGQRMYYILMLGCLLYVVGFSAIGTGSGERIRFPVLLLMLPVFIHNASALARWRVPRLSPYTEPETAQHLSAIRDVEPSHKGYE
jgi:hypothetical protein